ncbi:hypothetical protein SP15_271A [Bacillus phage SP-15]|uniref:Uncharacterized protein n=1 Tax=Bacillus phage SP-15 TaxID=1792032 RepID=A0A127AWK2_9CAUD|nr:hypothetical protein SP15_271A [Bacillus phage SP-15]AMM45079.1 hypothetical protein SP15_271A [Bacillus phage SP-15]
MGGDRGGKQGNSTLDHPKRPNIRGAFSSNLGDNSLVGANSFS